MSHHHIKVFGQSPHTKNWVEVNNLKDVKCGEFLSPKRGGNTLVYDRLFQEINCAIVLRDKPDSNGRYLVADGGLLRFRTYVIPKDANVYTNLVGKNLVLCEFTDTDGVVRYSLVPAGTSVAGSITKVDTSGGTIGLLTGASIDATGVANWVEVLLKLRR